MPTLTGIPTEFIAFWLTFWFVVTAIVIACRRK